MSETVTVSIARRDPLFDANGVTMRIEESGDGSVSVQLQPGRYFVIASDGRRGWITVDTAGRRFKADGAFAVPE